MLILNSQYQWNNPTTQLSLSACCWNDCSSQKSNINGKIYQGENNVTRWTLFNRTDLQEFFSQSSSSFTDLYLVLFLLGMKTSHFTVDEQLFSLNPSGGLWRFVVVYSFSSGRSTSALDFLIYPPLENRTTLTLFTVSCPDWFDDDGIKDYSLLVWSNASPQRSLIALSSESHFEVYLPTSDDLRLMIRIRD